MEYPRAGVLILAPFVVGYYLSYLFRTINALIADRLAAELALTASQLGLLTAAYFVTFAAIQLPLGVWLDRHGPRRVQSMLLSTAAVGVTTFSLAGGFISLLIGRALIGLGAAGALMAGLKAIALWFPKERVTLLNGLFVTLGALGAVTATAPAEAVLDMTGWRGLFIMLAPATALCAAAIFLFVPDPAGRTKSSSGAARLSRPIGLKEIFADPRFWRLAPLSATCIGTSWALQGLWAASWFADVERLDRAEVVRRLFVMALALCAAALGLGIAADRLRRRGVAVRSLLVGAALLFITAQVALVLRWPLPSVLLWSIVAGMGAATVLSFAALAEEFPTESIGQANGALNVLHLVAAFITQAGIGLIVQQWPSVDGRYPAAAYQAALAVSLSLQTAAVLWFIRPQRCASRKCPAKTSRRFCIVRRRRYRTSDRFSQGGRGLGRPTRLRRSAGSELAARRDWRDGADGAARCDFGRRGEPRRGGCLSSRCRAWRRARHRRRKRTGPAVGCANRLYPHALHREYPVVIERPDRRPVELA